MKKSLFTSVAVAALVFGIGSSQAFAKGKENSPMNPFGHPMGNFSERNFNPCTPNMPWMNGPEFGGIENADLLGTITAVNAETKTLTVKDADGKETQVHVNPFTKLKERKSPSVKENEPAEKDNAPSEKKRKLGREQNNFPRPEINELKISELKTGDWVAVKKMHTETKTIEAARIIVVKE